LLKSVIVHGHTRAPTAKNKAFRFPLCGNSAKNCGHFMCVFFCAGK
jgi:hypothetical protein